VAKLHKLTGYEQKTGVFFAGFWGKSTKKCGILDEKVDFGDKICVRHRQMHMFRR
jgi:hypothetical protein